MYSTRIIRSTNLIISLVQHSKEDCCFHWDKLNNCPNEPNLMTIDFSRYSVSQCNRFSIRFISLPVESRVMLNLYYKKKIRW